MSLFLQAMQQKHPAEPANGVQPEPAGADTGAEAELTLEPTGQAQPGAEVFVDEPAVAQRDRSAAQPRVAPTVLPEPDDLESQPPAAAPAVAADVRPPATQSAAAAALGSIAIIEPILMLVAALAVIGLLAGLYLLLAGFESFGERQRADLQHEMDTWQAQVSELQVIEVDDIAVDNRQPSPGVAAGVPADQQVIDEDEEPVVVDTVPSSNDTDGAGVLVGSESGLAAGPDVAVADSPAIDDVLSAEFASLKVQMSVQNARIDQLIDENSRLQKLVVATPAAVSKNKLPTTEPQKADSEKARPAKKASIPVVSISEQPARASVPARVDGAQTGVGARSIDDEAVAVTDRFRLLLRQGYSAYQSGDYAAADSFYDQALLLEPYNRDANLAVASVARQLGDFRRAENRYRHLLSLDGQDSSAFTGLLDVAAALGDDAIEHEMVAHIGTIESPGRMHAALGNYYSAKRSWQLARDAWRDALAIDVSNPDYAFNLAVSLDNLQRHNSAIDYYEIALEHTATRTFHFDKPSTRGRLDRLIAARGQ